MAGIATDLLLLLLDNAAARPALDDTRRRRLLGAAVVLDLAYLCRLRPSEPGDPAPPGRLVMLMGPDPADSVLSPALQVLARKPIGVSAAIHRIGRHAERRLFEQLEATRELAPIPLASPTGVRTRQAWTLTDRTRPARVRAEMLAVLTENRAPGPGVASLITVLHSAGALHTLLSFNTTGWKRVHHRAGEIASGSWAHQPGTQAAEINLVVTTAVVRDALLAG